MPTKSRTQRQKEGVLKGINADGRGSLVYATGFGKTRVACMIIKSFVGRNPLARVLISVPTEVLKNQWIDTLIESDLFLNCQVEIINTLIKHEGETDLLIIDEAHRVAAPSFKTIFDKVDYQYILCLTGTMERLDGKEKYIKEFCPVVDTITVQEAVEMGGLSSYKDYKVLIDVDLTEYKEIDRKFNLYFAYFDYNFQLAMKCATNIIFRRTYAKKLGLDHKEVMAMAMDWMRCMNLRKKFVVAHPKKLEITHKILEARSDKKCITFSATIKDAEKIKYGAVLSSKQTKKKNKITLEEFNNQLFGVINTSKKLDEGADLKGLSVGIILAGDSSMIKKVQRTGRIIRAEEGKRAEMFTLIIRGTMEELGYNNATNTSYITVDEEQLEKVLNYQPIESRQRENIKNLSFRF